MRKGVHLVGLSHIYVCVTMHGSENVKCVKSC